MDITFVQVIFSIIIAVHYSDGVEIHTSPCGNPKRSGPNGMIASPRYPEPFPHQVKCEWIIESPVNAVLKLEILDLDLDLDTDGTCHYDTCCNQHWLSIPNEGGRGSYILCGRKAPSRPITVSQRNTSIQYYSSEIQKSGRGFTLRYTIEETLCGSTEYQCLRTGSCVNNSSRCNGIWDCTDGSDEESCTEETRSEWCAEGRSPCPLTPKHCFSSHYQLCDGEFACPHGEDELGCAPGCPNQIACSSGDGCYEPAQRCNGIRNCRDNSDETDCSEVACGPLQFVCLKGGCVSASSLCDGIDDCGDLSDEKHCTRTSLLTAASLGLLACVFLSCIGLSCLYRFYTSRLRASTAFLSQLDVEGLDETFVHREPPPSYSEVVAESRAMSCGDLEPPPARSHRHRSRRHRRRRSHGEHHAASHAIGPNLLLSVAKQPVVSHVELANVALEPRWETPRSSPSISPSRHSVTSSTSLEDLMLHTQPSTAP